MQKHSQSPTKSQLLLRDFSFLDNYFLNQCSKKIVGNCFLRLPYEQSECKASKKAIFNDFKFLATKIYSLLFMLGKTTHSRTDLFIRKAKKRSLIPKPKAFGIPYSRASTKSSSIICASASPASRSFI